MSLFITDSAQPERIRPPSPPAVFGLPVRTLNIAAHWLSPATGALLAAEIGRNPANLHLHVQRISLWKSLCDEHELGAAVVDLCLTLGTHGLDLRKRMLLRYRQALMRVGLVEFLERSLLVGADRHDPQVARPGVILARPVAGRRQFLRLTRPSRQA
ncbi:MAG TPA: hypothetical protein PKN13_10770 [Accumulibacter sp.]|nr:hypothetical protein [Accumulibacter sp.]HMX21875.1 hypothetical protein [Accumulibacter sp.]HNC18760.1 hypothetical protein [Accumulibacter sp.]HND81100.1 hypothetical protein [Accumulibacter sp.]HNE13713.1 hypothetical protein [Accumulibacter sp.]